MLIKVFGDYRLDTSELAKEMLIKVFGDYRLDTYELAKKDVH